MSDVRVTTIVEWTDDDGTARRHDLPAGSDLRAERAVPGFVGRVMGPRHEPYWLRADGAVSKKAEPAKQNAPVATGR